MGNGVFAIHHQDLEGRTHLRANNCLGQVVFHELRCSTGDDAAIDWPNVSWHPCFIEFLIEWLSNPCAGHNSCPHRSFSRSHTCDTFKKTGSKKFRSTHRQAQLRAKKPEELVQLLREHQVLLVADDGQPEAPLKVDLPKLRHYWSDHSVLVWDSTTKAISCSCWYYQRRGHCPHSWSIAVLQGSLESPTPMPLQKDAHAGEKKAQNSFL